MLGRTRPGAQDAGEVGSSAVVIRYGSDTALRNGQHRVTRQRVDAYYRGLRRTPETAGMMEMGGERAEKALHCGFIRVSRDESNHSKESKQ